MFPPPRVEVTLDDSSLGAAWDNYRKLRRARSRGNDTLARKIMRYLISFTIAKIPAGDVAKIERDLLAVLPKKPPKTSRKRKTAARAGKRLTALAEKYGGTRAAYLVQRLNWKDANTAKNKNGSPAFWGRVGRFVGARKWSRNHHRAGFFPVLERLRPAPGKSPGYMPKERRAPGSYQENIGDTLTTLIAENEAASAARPGKSPGDGVAVLAPGALQKSIAELRTQIAAWLALEEREAWQKSLK